MQQPDDTSAPQVAPHPTTMPTPVARPPADGATPRLAVPVPAPVPPSAPPALPASSAQRADRPPLAPRPRSLAEELLAPILPDGATAWLASWRRRAGWLALVTLLVLLPIAQWGSSTSDLFAAASAARAAWRYDRALADYAHIAQIDPSDPRPHCLQGQVLALQQLYAQAQAAYATCEQLGDTGPNTWLAQGDAANSGGQLAAAEQDWLHAVVAGSRTAHRRLALLYEQQGRFDAATAQWQALGPNDPQAQEHLGLLALQAGDYPAARAAFVQARTLPGFYGQEAVDDGFVALAALPPQDAPGFAALGGDFIQANLLPLARQPVEQAIALDPSYGPAHAYLAWLLYGAGQHAAAAQQATLAVRQAPLFSFGWFVAAELALQAGQWSAAVTDLQAGLSHDNANPVLWAALGQAYLAQHDYVHADISLSDAAQLGNEPQFTEQLMQYYLAHGVGVALGRAAPAASTALTRFPNNAEVALLAGEVYEQSQDMDQAYAAYLRANTLDPSLPDPYFYLGRLALNGAEYDQAALDLSTYLALRPKGDLATQARTLLQPLGVFNL